MNIFQTLLVLWGDRLCEIINTSRIKLELTLFYRPANLESCTSSCFWIHGGSLCFSHKTSLVSLCLKSGWRGLFLTSEAFGVEASSVIFPNLMKLLPFIKPVVKENSIRTVLEVSLLEWQWVEPFSPHLRPSRKIQTLLFHY